MTRSVRDHSADIPAGTLYAPAIFLILAMSLCAATLRFSGVDLDGAPRGIVDFHAFYAASRLIAQGAFDQAYAFADMSRAEAMFGGPASFLPWSYPPPYGVIVAPLSAMPLGMAYFSFVAVTLLVYLLVLRVLSGRYFVTVLLITLPACLINLASGQNGFLSGALIGLTCLGVLRRKPGAGLPLGLMVIKPHLVVGLGLFMVATRRWRDTGIALATIAMASVLATVLFHPAVWLAFSSGMREAGEFLAQARYPLHRMISLYAALRSFGLPSAWSFAAQILVAAFSVAVLIHTIRGQASDQRKLGVATLVSLFISPYAYDYDLTIAAVALALLMPELMRLASPREQAGLAALTFFACGFGLARTTDFERQFGADQIPLGYAPLSLAGFALLGVLLLTSRVLQRETQPSLPSASGNAKLPQAIITP